MPRMRSGREKKRSVRDMPIVKVKDKQTAQKQKDNAQKEHARPYLCVVAEHCVQRAVSRASKGQSRRCGDQYRYPRYSQKRKASLLQQQQQQQATCCKSGETCKMSERTHLPSRWVVRTIEAEPRPSRRDDPARPEPRAGHNPSTKVSRPDWTQAIQRQS
jgi:hypothetical protein